jgi:urease accessory protein
MRADIAGICSSLDATFFPGEPTCLAASAPLEMRGPFTSGDGIPLYLLKNVTAGVFAGDRYDVTLNAAAGSRSRVGTTSATKVHAMPSGHAQSRLTVRASEDACIVVSPSPVILQAESDFRQVTRIVAAPSSTAIVSDIVVFGRLARDERLAFRHFGSELSVSRGEDDAPWHTKRFVLTPAENGPAIEAAMGRHGVLGTLIAATPRAAKMIEDVRGALADSHDCYAGASVLAGEGLIVQVLASRSDSTMRALGAVETAILARIA